VCRNLYQNYGLKKSRFQIFLSYKSTQINFFSLLSFDSSLKCNLHLVHACSSISSYPSSCVNIRHFSQPFVNQMMVSNSTPVILRWRINCFNLNTTCLLFCFKLKINTPEGISYICQNVNKRL